MRPSLFAALLVGCAGSLASGAQIDYLTQIKPLLSVKCYSCHGALKQRSGLRLEARQLMIRGGENGQVIVPGNSRESALVARITADEADRMPPASEGAALTADEIELIRQWIDQGAESPAESIPADPRDHWAFRPLERPDVPDVANEEWTRNPVDRFVANQHERYGLTPQAEPERSILLRRLYFDLIGLPPTADAITAFENDRSVGSLERMAERLLADPRHGERWARHWMDVWRYSDWWGYAGQLRNSQKHIWHWRDWIIESLNANLPYDEMVRLMLAADELHPNDLNTLRATGFLARNYFLFNRNQWLDETVEHVGKGLLGLTLNCAKCHDHKYDPIAQSDYYAMRAFFEPYHVRLDVLPGQPDLAIDGIPRVYDGLLDTPTYLFVRGQENHPDKSAPIAPGVPELLEFQELQIQPVPLPVEAWQPERRPWVISNHLSRARAEIASSEARLTEARHKLDTAQQEARTEAQAELRVAETAAVLARARLKNVERRADASRAAWATLDRRAKGTHPDAGETAGEETRAAVLTERQLAVARARHLEAEAELELLRAGEDTKKDVETKLTKARQTLQQARQKAESPVKSDSSFSSFTGAQWTATRFLFSGKDDPVVAFSANSSGRRTALAEWITDRRNPLTARVAVNHIWLRHMGSPLVASVADFGRNGSAPTHVELLDWLACELVDSGWNMKHLHRMIVTSTTYRMKSSAVGAESNAARDPDNLRWWRRTPIRLESQAVRDSILAHAGKLDLTIGGPPVLPKQQDDSPRRSLYFFHSGNDRNLFLTTFDEALVKECYRREQSVMPQQALALTNSRLVLDAAQSIADRLPHDAGADNSTPIDDRVFVQRAFKALLGMPPLEAEANACLTALARGAGRAQLVWALLNHNDFVTIR